MCFISVYWACELGFLANSFSKNDYLLEQENSHLAKPKQTIYLKSILCLFVCLNRQMAENDQAQILCVTQGRFTDD